MDVSGSKRSLKPNKRDLYRPFRPSCADLAWSDPIFDSKLIECDLAGGHVETSEHFDCGLNHGGRTAEIILDAGWIGMGNQISL